MSNVIKLNVPRHNRSREDRIADLIASFAHQRRIEEDVFWLKENAELLNILECTHAELTEEALLPHQGFYASVENRIEFFPQYYRFILSICLDLEDLGLPGNKGEALAHWIAQQGLAESELSDLQRGEAERLLARRGAVLTDRDDGLRDRLHNFMARSATFSMPNKKVAYELTHIVFYLSEYGRVCPGLSQEAITSLEYAGILAYLDQNADLLAEICVALRFAGQEVSNTWEDWLEEETFAFQIENGPQVSVADDYHDYFVCNWALATAGRDSFAGDMASERLGFFKAPKVAAPLRVMSECMFRMESGRSDDWAQMRPIVEQHLDDAGYGILAQAEMSSDKFDSFFAGFARTGLRGELA